LKIWGKISPQNSKISQIYTRKIKTSLFFVRKKKGWGQIWRKQIWKVDFILGAQFRQNAEKNRKKKTNNIPVKNHQISGKKIRNNFTTFGFLF
jgi:hypothetical protein